MRFFSAILLMVLAGAILIVYRPAVVDAQIESLCDRFATEQFRDVDSGDYGAEYILCMKTLGLSYGTADGGYGPDAELTRAQMAWFLVRLWRDVWNRQCPGGGAPFTDVTAGNPHGANIDCLYNLGITKGVTATTFGPESKLTASQISRFLLRTYEKAGETCPDLKYELDEAVSCLQGLNVIPTASEGRSGGCAKTWVLALLLSVWGHVTRIPRAA